MAATVIIEGKWGASSTITATALNMLGTDASPNTTASDSSIQKPSAGNTGYSYERWFRAKVTALTDITRVENFRVYISSATPQTGVTYNYGQTATYCATNSTPTDDASDVATATMPTTIPSENLYISGSSGNNIDATDEYTDYGVIQVELDGDTVGVTSGSPTVTIVWDEIA